MSTTAPENSDIWWSPASSKSCLNVQHHFQYPCLSSSSKWSGSPVSSSVRVAHLMHWQRHTYSDHICSKSFSFIRSSSLLAGPHLALGRAASRSPLVHIAYLHLQQLHLHEALFIAHALLPRSKINPLLYFACSTRDLLSDLLELIDLLKAHRPAVLVVQFRQMLLLLVNALQHLPQLAQLCCRLSPGPRTWCSLPVSLSAAHVAAGLLLGVVCPGLGSALAAGVTTLLADLADAGFLLLSALCASTRGAPSRGMLPVAYCRPHSHNNRGYQPVLGCTDLCLVPSRRHDAFPRVSRSLSRPLHRPGDVALAAALHKPQDSPLTELALNYWPTGPDPFYLEKDWCIPTSSLYWKVPEAFSPRS
eukprot:g47745.t1